MGSKRQPYEESIRVPLYIRAPGYVINAMAQQPVLNNDLAPTIADLAGVSPPYDPDGTSLVPLLIDPARGDWHRKSFVVEHWFIPSILNYELATNYSIRSLSLGRDFLYTQTAAQLGDPVATHREFYNLITDPYQIDSIDLSTATNGLLDQFLGLFLGCQGQFCRQLESF